MSLVKETIQTLLKSNSKMDLKSNLPKLLDEIAYYKNQTKKYVEENYVDFLFFLPKNESYFEECDQLFVDCQALLNSIECEAKEHTAAGSAELQQHKIELQKIVIELKVLTKILRIHDLFNEIDLCNQTDNHLDVINHVFELETIIKEPDRVFRQLNCFENINERFLIEHTMMLESLKEKFSQLVQLSEKQFQNNKLVNVKITKDVEELNKIVVALVSTNFNPQAICTFLLDNVFEPIITKPVSLEFLDNNPNYVELKLSFSVKPKAETELKPNYQIVFRNLKTAWNCLNYMNIFVEQQNLFIFNIFRDKFDRFLRLLLDECLYKAVPGTMDEMKDSTLIQDVSNLNTFLTDLHFLRPEEPNLIKFINSVDLLFRNKFSMNVLNNAVEIMRRDMSDMVLMSSGEATQDQDETNPTIFPKCMISKSTVELINLMNKIIRQIDLSDASAAGDNQTRIQLLSIVSVILDRYITEVVTYHKKLLMTIPHLTALFYNNCMYLSFWAGKNVSVLNLASDSQLLTSIRQLGCNHFDEQVKNQKCQLFDILKEFQFNGSITEMPTNALRCVRQCLRQLDLLKNVWQTILPDSQYNKTMGSLLNDFCLEIIRKVLTVEDIPTPIANGLVELITLIVERAPPVFTDPLRVSVIVKSWSKLSQLKMILSASLLEITEHWAEGTGALTLNFRAEEIKHLIRALFQNTKRRADALNKII